jgi:hypothetical protein
MADERIDVSAAKDAARRVAESRADVKEAGGKGSAGSIPRPRIPPPGGIPRPTIPVPGGKPRPQITVPGGKPRPRIPLPTPPVATPPATPVVTAPPPAPPVVPEAPSDNPFDSLPFVSPGDRIKADDFNKLSQSLILIRDAWQLSTSLMGHEFGESKLALLSQQYVIASVMSVFGHEIADVDDPSLDSRKVIQVVPLELGEKNVAVVVTEAVETRRTVPNLLNLTQAEAAERLEGVMGDITIPSDSIRAPQLVGLTLEQAKAVTGR